MPAKATSLFLRFQDTRGAVVGEDSLAEDWARFAATQEADVDLFHPHPSEQFQNESAGLTRIRWVSREFAEEDLTACDWLIVTSTERSFCKNLSAMARQNHVWHAVIHFPELGNIAVPRVFNFEEMQIVLPVSTNHPPAGETISRSWQRILPPDFSRALQLLRWIEKRVEEQIPERRFRTRVLDSLFDSHLSKLIWAGRWDAAEVLVNKVLQSYAQNPERRQRISPRVGVQLTIRFQADGHSHSGKLFNLSRDGAFIATRSILPKLTHLTSIEFTLPGGVPISQAEGFVVWKNPAFNPRVPIYPPGIAVMFDSLSTDNLNAIEQYVQSQLK